MRTLSRSVLPVFALVVLALLAPLSARQTDHLLCSANPVPPFTVTSGAPYSAFWLMADTALEGGVTVPNRVDGFYVQVDMGAKTDIGMATALPACSATSPRPGDVPYTYRMPSGVARGAHTFNVSAWSFKLDGNGNPTTTRQESAVTSVPFTAGDPLLFGPPMAPQFPVIARDSTLTPGTTTAPTAAKPPAPVKK